jgi:UDP-N-acetyl-D-mannosaminuronate dehydrogenase
MNVCVIGLGQIGFPVAKYIAAKGFDVYGFDINPAAVEHAIQNGKFKATTQWNQIPKADAYIICVTTSQVNNQAELTAVFEVCKKAAEKQTQTRWLPLKAQYCLEPQKRFSKKSLTAKSSLFMHHTVTGQTKKTNTA